MPHEQIAVLEQLTDLAVDPLVAPPACRAALVACGRPRGSLGALAASRFRSWATAERTALGHLAENVELADLVRIAPKTVAIGSG